MTHEVLEPFFSFDFLLIIKIFLACVVTITGAKIIIPAIFSYRSEKKHEKLMGFKTKRIGDKSFKIKRIKKNSHSIFKEHREDKSGLRNFIILIIVISIGIIAWSYNTVILEQLETVIQPIIPTGSNEIIEPAHTNVTNNMVISGFMYGCDVSFTKTNNIIQKESVMINCKDHTPNELELTRIRDKFITFYGGQIQ